MRTGTETGLTEIWIGRKLAPADHVLLRAIQQEIVQALGEKARLYRPRQSSGVTLIPWKAVEQMRRHSSALRDFTPAEVSHAIMGSLPPGHDESIKVRPRWVTTFKNTSENKRFIALALSSEQLWEERTAAQQTVEFLGETSLVTGYAEPHLGFGNFETEAVPAEAVRALGRYAAYEFSLEPTIVKNNQYLLQRQRQSTTG